MGMFNPAAFTLPEETPPLVGGVGQGGLADTFVAVFGTRWKKTPVKGTYALLADGVQFTCRKLPCGGLDIGVYNYDTGMAFREDFNRKELMEPLYFQWSAQETRTKYPFVFLVEKMKEHNLWHPCVMNMG